MTSQEIIQTLFPAKKEKLKQILEWIDNNCDQHMKEEAAQIISDYGDFIITFPSENMLRITHELTARDNPLIHHVPSQEEYVKGHLPEDYSKNLEIRKRKQIINGLQTEIQELRHL